MAPPSLGTPPMAPPSLGTAARRGKGE